MTIRVGIGGWTYEPWRGTFFPPGLSHARELAHAARRVTAIEVNGTYYGRQKPATFANWAKTVPDGFVFSLKASRFCTNRKILADAGESVANFLGQGLTELGDKLGPILWQFAATKRFEPDDFAAFLKLLPETQDGLPLAHAIEARHESFDVPEFRDMVRAAGAAIVYADARDHPQLSDLAGPFVYARLQDQHEEEPAGYSPSALDGWADEARTWAEGGRDVFVFMINGAKVRAPAAAEALQQRLGIMPLT